MDFFRKLSEICAGATNVTLKILEKNGVMTIQVLPEGTATLRPLIATGTPAELDVEFLPGITGPLKKTAGVMLNVEGFEKDLEQLEKEKKEAVDAAKGKKTSSASATKAAPAAAKTTPKPGKKKETGKPAGFAFEEEEDEQQAGDEDEDDNTEEARAGEPAETETDSLTDNNEENGNN